MYKACWASNILDKIIDNELLFLIAFIYFGMQKGNTLLKRYYMSLIICNMFNSVDTDTGLNRISWVINNSHPNYYSVWLFTESSIIRVMPSTPHIIFINKTIKMKIAYQKCIYHFHIWFLPVCKPFQDWN